eukprot:TRINITY_DN7097_c0_g1_i2.p1 TRINITY_DN7097_c0_g1~~TRINITY_DN7097_c0_g1_i2.p1  ORF type:complete len:252 (-),score=58.39 TRINITY_DN7097_c0_g1_i2:101-856(-)
MGASQCQTCCKDDEVPLPDGDIAIWRPEAPDLGSEFIQGPHFQKAAGVDVNLSQRLMWDEVLEGFQHRDSLTHAASIYGTVERKGQSQWQEVHIAPDEEEHGDDQKLQRDEELQSHQELQELEKQASQGWQELHDLEQQAAHTMQQPKSVQSQELHRPDPAAVEEQVPSLPLGFTDPNGVDYDVRATSVPLGLDFTRTMPCKVKRVKPGGHGESLGVQEGWMLRAVDGEDVSLLSGYDIMTLIVDKFHRFK